MSGKGICGGSRGSGWFGVTCGSPGHSPVLGKAFLTCEEAGYGDNVPRVEISTYSPR